MKNNQYAFTLVELLVVITIIGIIMALALPALNAARESARVLQCKNHLKQLGTGCFTHASEQLTLPSGGWGWQFSGNPARGFREIQPGGWLYNILPFIDNQPLHDLFGPDRMRTPVTLYHCPSKRKAITYPFIHTGNVMCYVDRNGNLTTLNGKTSIVARSDYAANAGTRADANRVGTSSAYFDGDKYIEGLGAYANPHDAKYQNTAKVITHVRKYFSNRINNINDNTGTYCPGTGKSLQTISDADGAANTIMIGERHVNPDEYYTGAASDDDQGWDQGYDRDTVRWGGGDCCGAPDGVDSESYNLNHNGSQINTSMLNNNSDPGLGMAHANMNYTTEIIEAAKKKYTRQNLSRNYWIPIQDKAGYTSPARWGAPHGDTINFCMADSSVKSVSYGVDPFIFWCLCNYKDGQSIPANVLR